MISTKGRYALRVLIDLAENCSDGYIPMKDVAARQGLSLKYIERIMPLLTKNNIVKGIHGKGGGYCLTKSPKEYRVGEILRIAEGDLSPVACLGCNAKSCDRSAECKTLPMWKDFYQLINNYFDGITIYDLIQQAPNKINLTKTD